MKIIEVLAYICGGLFALLCLYTFVVERLLTRFIARRKNQKEVNQKTLNSDSPTRYFKFHYDGPIYFEAPAQLNANRLFKGFKRQQDQFSKLYRNARMEKEKQRQSKIKKQL